MLPSVLPCVPLPLPGAPNRMNVLYLMSEIRLYRNAAALTTVEIGLAAESALKPISTRSPDRHSRAGLRDRSEHSHQPAQKWCNRGRGQRSCPAKISSRAA